MKRSEFWRKQSGRALWAGTLGCAVLGANVLMGGPLWLSFLFSGGSALAFVFSAIATRMEMHHLLKEAATYVAQMKGERS